MRALARDGVSREVPCSALKGETVPDSLPATPKSPPTRRGPPRAPGESGLVLSEEGNSACLSSCSGSLSPLMELCVETAGVSALGSPIFPSGCEGTLGVALESLQGLRPWPVACQAPLSMGFSQARILEWVAISFSNA